MGDMMVTIAVDKRAGPESSSTALSAIFGVAIGVKGSRSSISGSNTDSVLIKEDHAVNTCHLGRQR